MPAAGTGQYAGPRMPLLRRHHEAPPDDPKTRSALGAVHFCLPLLRAGRLQRKVIGTRHETASDADLNIVMADVLALTEVNHNVAHRPCRAKRTNVLASSRATRRFQWRVFINHLEPPRQDERLISLRNARASVRPRSRGP
jgi:hypothetical protein